jgi:hypothetical protein
VGDPFSAHYEDLLEGSYDCVDRIVLNGRVANSLTGTETWDPVLDESLYLRAF